MKTKTKSEPIGGFPVAKQAEHVVRVPAEPCTPSRLRVRTGVRAGKDGLIRICVRALPSATGLCAVLVASAGCAMEVVETEEPEETVDSQSEGIIGGSAVGPEVRPAVVYFRGIIGGTFTGGCTGTFVSDRHLLTAKHCLAVSPTLNYVTPSDVSIQWTRETSWGAGQTTSKVVTIYRDAAGPHSNDIQVLMLEGAPSRHWHTLHPFAVPAGPQGAGFSMMGYGCNAKIGETEEDASTNGVRRHASLPANSILAHPWNSTELIDSLAGCSAWGLVCGYDGVVHPPSSNGGSDFHWNGLIASSDRWLRLLKWQAPRFVESHRLQPSGANVCEGDSGGPLFYSTQLVGVATNRDHRFHASFHERVDAHIPWLQAVGVMPFAAPANLSIASPVAGEIKVDASNLLPNSPIYYDQLGPAAPVWGGGPIGTANVAGGYSATFPTAGWAKGTYHFRAYTVVPGGFRTTNEASVTVN